MDFTIIIIAITCIVSFLAFNNDELYNKLILWPYKMHEPSEYYRLLSSGFIHADWPHLIFNMIALYGFGRYVEFYLGNTGMFLTLYLAGIVIASLPSYLKNRNNGYYRSLGASGGVSAILFASIYFDPWVVIRIWFIPIPAIIAGIAYLFYSAYASKHGRDNVNHDAHFWGAVFGFLFTLVIEPSHGLNFLSMLLHPSFNL